MVKDTFLITEINANSLKACLYAHFFYSCLNTPTVLTHEYHLLNIIFLVLWELPKCVQFWHSFFFSLRNWLFWLLNATRNLASLIYLQQCLLLSLLFIYIILICSRYFFLDWNHVIFLSMQGIFSSNPGI